MDRDFEFGGRKFKLSKIDAFKQFHIVRRIGPILSDLLPAMQGIGALQKSGDSESLSEEQKFKMVEKFAAPLMTGFSKLTDADAEIVLHGLLQSVEVQQAAGNWARVSTGSMLMIQDLELPHLLRIAGQAFMFNLAGFFAALPQK